MGKLSTREKIIEIADQLFYEQGYEFTSFAHIAEKVGISRGNFYHHFKTKDDILEAVIQKRLVDREALLSNWEKDAKTPKERILLYTRILIFNQDKILQFGCPVGTLTSELSKLDHPMTDQAGSIMTLFREWLKSQFLQYGFQESEADDHALHVLAWSQGVATLANTFKDTEFVNREVAGISQWLDEALLSLSTQ